MLGVYAQQDSLIFNSGEDMVGEIKSLENGIIIVETKYSDKDFNIKWENVSQIYTETIFLILLTNGDKYFGKLSSDSTGKERILFEEDQYVECDINEFVSLTPLKNKFLDRLYASIDLGFSLTKANELRQLSSRIALGYTADNWTTNLKLNTILSMQNETETIRRIEGSINERYIFSKNWFAIFELSGLSNTEQKLDLRLNAELGMGHFLIRTNSLYWSVKAGFNRNVEQYSNETPDRQSWEGFFGTAANFFNTGDFQMQTIIKAYPSITYAGRWRTDWTLDVKYDLPLDFYIKVGGTLNFDNRPAEDASRSDYVLQSGFGWEW